MLHVNNAILTFCAAELMALSGFSRIFGTLPRMHLTREYGARRE